MGFQQGAFLKLRHEGNISKRRVGTRCPRVLCSKAAWNRVGINAHPTSPKSSLHFKTSKVQAAFLPLICYITHQRHRCYSRLKLQWYGVGSPWRTTCTLCGSPPCLIFILIHYILGKLWNQQKSKPLTPLTAVIGKNGVGESTIFDAFGFLSDCLKQAVACMTNHRVRSYATHPTCSGTNFKTNV